MKLSQGALMLALTAAMGVAQAQPEVKLQPILSPTGALPTGSVNHNAMSRSGRYVLMPNTYGQSGQYAFYLRDIKTQTTSRVSPIVSNVDWNHYAISGNGQYLAFRLVGETTTRIYNVASASHQSISRVAETNIGLADDGSVLYIKAAGAIRQLVLRASSGSETLIADNGADGGQSSLSLGSLYQRDPLSRDGKTALFRLGQQFQLWRQGQGVVAITPDLSLPGWDLSALTVSNVALASDGSHIAFLTSAPWNSADGGDYSGRYLHLLSSDQLTASAVPQRFDLAPHLVKLRGGGNEGLSLSANGRYVTFNGYLLEGHPEYAKAANGGPDRGFNRVFRYDTQTDSLITLTVTHNGAAPLNEVGSDPLVNTTSVVSDDGSMAIFPTNAMNLLPYTSRTSGGESPFHLYADNGYARNYQFVEMPNSDNGWKPFAPMALVDDNLWQGYLRFDGAGTDALKFDVGGSWDGFTFVATANWVENYGSGGGAGQAIRSGGNINVSGGAGLYRITFNDATKAYSISKVQENAGDWRRTVIFIKGQTIAGQDMFIRGGIDHGYAQTVLGRSCTSSNLLCAIPIRYRNLLNPYTSSWKSGDLHLDWYGREPSQTLGNTNGLAEGSVLDWTTSNSANANKVAVNGFGYSPLNIWGDHYWMLDVEMDCSKTVNGWFELKSFISGGPGWEANVSQSGTPYSSGNHFARCGQLNMFERGSSAATFLPLP